MAKGILGLLLSEEARPQAVADGFVCSLCEREGKHCVFQSLEALWQHHLFRPLEEWINTKLANAQAVALFRMDSDDSTRAKLIPAGKDASRPTLLVPLKWGCHNSGSNGRSRVWT
jgi:hypothetical protein